MRYPRVLSGGGHSQCLCQFDLCGERGLKSRAVAGYASDVGARDCKGKKGHCRAHRGKEQDSAENWFFQFLFLYQIARQSLPNAVGVVLGVMVVISMHDGPWVTIGEREVSSLSLINANPKRGQNQTCDENSSVPSFASLHRLHKSRPVLR